MVEHFFGKEEVKGPIPFVGFLRQVLNAFLQMLNSELRGEAFFFRWGATGSAQASHSVVKAALEAGAEAEELSRHAKLETLMRYDDSRTDKQGKVSRLLSSLI